VTRPRIQLLWPASSCDGGKAGGPFGQGAVHDEVEAQGGIAHVCIRFSDAGSRRVDLVANADYQGDPSARFPAEQRASGVIVDGV